MIFEIIILALVSIGGYVGYTTFFKWPITVMIYEERMGKLFLSKLDKAKRVKKGGKEYYRLKKSKVSIQPFKYKQIQGTNIISLYSPSGSDFYAMKPELLTKKIRKKDKDGVWQEKMIKDPVFVPIPESRKLWYALWMEEVNRRTITQEKWQIYLPIVALAVMIVSIGVALMLIFNAMEPLVDALNAAGANFVEASKNIGCKLAEGVSSLY